MALYGLPEASIWPCADSLPMYLGPHPISVVRGSSLMTLGEYGRYMAVTGLQLPDTGF